MDKSAMDERWLLDALRVPPFPEEHLEFGAHTARVDGCVIWTGPTDPGGTPVATFRGDLLPAREVAFALVHGGVPKPPFYAATTCGELLCVAPSELTVRHPNDPRG